VRKSVYIAYVGGTIGMKRVGRNYLPVSGFLQQQLDADPAFRHPDLPDYTIHEYQPLLDSTNMTPADWSKIARDICQQYHQYDGFIVLHGTDTMAFTASALAFMLEGLAKPVIVTGSQIPLCEVRNDAQENLITSLIIAGSSFAIPEVGLYFHSQLFRGCRAVKVDADGFNAFASPNFPPLATVGTRLEINKHLVRRPPKQPADVYLQVIERPGAVGALRLFPGMSVQVLENILRPPLLGLVLETYGTGNAPNNDPHFLAALQAASKREVVIVDCTQCLRGTVDLDQYATGSALAEAGVISGFDMTAEAALTKLAYLFSAGHPAPDVKALMQQDLRGELTPR
jgi:L-asparaginase